MPLTAEDLRFNPPSIDPAVLTDTVVDFFGIEGELTPLVGERDQNMLVTTTAGERFVLKVAGSLEDPAVTECQTHALQHLERTAPEIPVPRIIMNRHGLAAATIVGDDGAKHVVRLLSYLNGVTYDDAGTITLSDARSIGLFMGEVSHALASFRHPAADHFMPWDISNGLIDDDELWTTASPETLAGAGPIREHMAGRTLPAMRKLRSQVIHGDAHVGNLLRSDASGHQICGLIDFGDLVAAPTLVDLAVLAASFIALHPDAATVVASVARGFNEVVPLTDNEISLVHDLILARQVLSALLFDFQLATGSTPDVEPGDRDDVLERMQRWLQVDPAELAARIH